MEELKNIFMSVVKDNYANFNGRARRREYWMYFLGYMILSIVVTIIVTILGFLGTVGAIIGMILNLGFGLALLVPTLAAGVRRLHDVNKSGWFILIPIYNLILMITEGDKGPNQYGADPKAGEA